MLTLPDILNNSLLSKEIRYNQNQKTLKNFSEIKPESYRELSSYIKDPGSEIDLKKDLKHFYKFTKYKICSELSSESDNLAIENVINQNFLKLKGVCKEIIVKESTDAKDKGFDQLPKELIDHIASYLNVTEIAINGICGLVPPIILNDSYISEDIKVIGDSTDCNNIIEE